MPRMAAQSTRSTPKRIVRRARTKTEDGRNQSGDKTRIRIIEAAEKLFADAGYEGASLRRIMANADVSISLINYHFGNKEGLLRAIFEHKAAPLNKQRRALIQDAMDARPVPDLDELLRGYFLPSFRDSLRRKPRADHFMRLVSRIGSDNSEIARGMMREFFDEFQVHFISALKLALPHLDEESIFWRLHCLLCIITHTLNNPDRIYDLSRGKCDFHDVDYAFEQLLPFLRAGLEAPMPAISARAPKKGRSTEHPGLRSATLGR
ncbi:MAG: TetR/AcrR family transcriptional regulator [Bradyrhizobium sp.]|nr:TetR/AcrR family transcriptional regulator [Bradyrhizobium sp.]